MISKNEKLSSRTVSMLEANCNFSVVEDNVFKIDSPNIFHAGDNSLAGNIAS